MPRIDVIYIKGIRNVSTGLFDWEVKELKLERTSSRQENMQTLKMFGKWLRRWK